MTMHPTNLDPRLREATMLERCAFVARVENHLASATDAKEANVFRVAAMVIQSRLPTESKALMDCANRYFLAYPKAVTPVIDVVRNGDIISLPRLRDLLTRKIQLGR